MRSTLKKNAKGTRKFTQDDIETLETIYHLVKVKGFTLEGAKIKLKERRKGPLSKMDIILKLTHIKRVLLQIKEEL